jgi:hypothetical protein
MACWAQQAHSDAYGYQHEASTCPSPPNVSRGDIPWVHHRCNSDPINSFHPKPAKFGTTMPPKRKTSNRPLYARNPSAQNSNGPTNRPVNRITSINIEDANIFSLGELSLDNLSRHPKALLKPRVPFPLVTKDFGDSGVQYHESSPIESLLQSRRTPADESSNMSPTYSAGLSLPGTTLGPGPGPGPSFGPPGRSLTPEKHSSTLSYQRDLPLDEEWTRLQNARLEVWSLRSKIQDMRVTLREKQGAMSRANDQYFKYIIARNHELKIKNRNISKENVILEELHERCRNARDEYGPLEDDCNLLEDQLGGEEFKLQKMEKAFYSRRLSPRGSQTDDRESRPSSSASSVSGISDIDQKFHPLVSKYLSSVGAVNILRERLEDQAEEKYALEQESARKERVNLRLSDENQKWLDEFPSNEALLLRQLQAAQEEGDSLKMECLSLGFIDDNGNPTGLEVQERKSLEKDVDAGRENSEFVKFPLLMSHQRSKQVSFYKSASGSGTPHSGDDINQWLLDQLRSSPLYVNLLARTYENEFGHIESEDWQLDVLAFWYKDGTRKSASDYRVYSSGIATQAPQKSQYSAKTLSDSGDSGSLGIFIRSSSLRAASSGTSSEKTRRIQGLLLPINSNTNLSKSL